MINRPVNSSQKYPLQTTYFFSFCIFGGSGFLSPDQDSNKWDRYVYLAILLKVSYHYLTFEKYTFRFCPGE